MAAFIVCIFHLSTDKQMCQTRHISPKFHHVNASCSLKIIFCGKLISFMANLEPNLNFRFGLKQYFSLVCFHGVNSRFSPQPFGQNSYIYPNLLDKILVFYLPFGQRLCFFFFPPTFGRILYFSPDHISETFDKNSEFYP